MMRDFIEDSAHRADLSVVIPMYNEKNNILPLYERLKAVLDKLGRIYEIIFVDDGSIDGSFSVLESIHKKDSRVKIIKLRRNFGQTSALRAGLEYARGQVIVSLDGDLQHAPEDIPLLINKMDEGYDIVAGWRKERKDALLSRKLPSFIANRLIRMISGVPIHDFGTTLRAYDRDVIKQIRLYGELHRFIPALASNITTRIAEVPIENPPRGSGKSNYGIMRTVRVILDLITVKFLLSYSKSPMQIFGLLGAAFSIAGFFMGGLLTVKKIFFHIAIGREPLLLLSVLLIVVGAQLITMGLLGEMIMRVYYESHERSIFSIEKVLDQDKV